MSGNNKKDKFQWEEGQSIADTEYEAVPEVRSRGLPKIKDAVHADPEKRKEERETLLVNEQSKAYREAVKDKKDDGTIVIEESQSGLSGDLEDTEAKKLIDPGRKIKGIDRFGKK